MSMFGREERVSAGVPVGIVDTDGGGVVESVVEGRVSCRHSCRQDRAERPVWPLWPCGGSCRHYGRQESLSFLWAFLWPLLSLSAGEGVVAPLGVSVGLEGVVVGRIVGRVSCRPVGREERVSGFLSSLLSLSAFLSAERPVWPLWPCGGFLWALWSAGVPVVVPVALVVPVGRRGRCGERRGGQGVLSAFLSAG